MNCVLRWSAAFVFGLALVPALVAQATPTVTVRNTDRAWMGWWPLEVGLVTPEAVLPRLLGPPRWVAPGERATLTPGRGQSVVVVFVPWGTRPGFLTPVFGGVIRPEVFPAQGTLLVDQASLAAAQGKGELRAPLQAWNLSPAPLVLDGSASDWPPGAPAWSWAPGFTTPRPWKGVPQPRELRLANQDGALWLWFSWEGRPSASVSLVLSRPGAALEWSLGDPTVWAWSGDRARPVGRSVVTEQGLEAWIPRDRLTEADLEAWNTGATWSLLTTDGATDGAGVTTYVLGEGGLGDAP